MRKPTRNLASRKLVTAALFTATLLWATNKGPDAGNYVATDSVVYSFIDPAGGGSAPSVLAGTDDGGAMLTLPFSFQFYGSSYTMLCVSSNGIAYFVNNLSFCGSQTQVSDFASVDMTAAIVPGDTPAIAPFWMDLTFAPAGAGAVYYQTIGTTVGSRQFVIEWYNAFPATSTSPVTFEAVLFEGSNKVLFQYQTVNASGNPASNGAAAAVGIRNTGGNTNNQGIQWSFDSPVLQNSYAIQFSGPSGTATSVNTIQTSPSGIMITVDGTLMATPATVYWTPQTSHTLIAPAPQTNGGVETAFSSWAYGNSTANTTQIGVTAQNTGITYTASFATEYQLTTSASPSNEGSVTVTAGGPFYTAGSTVSVQAKPASGYAFKGFSGDLTGATNPQNLVMNGAKNVIATFGLANPCLLTTNTMPGIADVQAIVNQALGKAQAGADINNDGVVNAIDVQIVVNAALNLGCTM